MTCKEIILEKLCELPSGWRDQMAELICVYIKEHNDSLLCSAVKDCETLTSLLNFEVDGTQVCISFKDELGITVDRCFDYDDVVNNFLNLLNPNCLASEEDWYAMSPNDKMQVMIDRVCEDCTDDDYVVSTTTTTSTSSTTTTTTLAEEFTLETDECFTYAATSEGVYVTNHQSHTTELFIPIAAQAIASTENKLWIANPYDSLIYEYDMVYSAGTLTATFNRTITLTNYSSVGIGAIDDTTLISTVTGQDLYVYDISASNVVTGTFLAGFPDLAYSVSGDIICDTVNDFTYVAVFNNGGWNRRIQKYQTSTGSFIGQSTVNTPFGALYGLTFYEGDLYAVRYDGNAYKVNSTTLNMSAIATFSIAVPSGTVLDTSGNIECIVPTTTTTTSTTTTTTLNVCGTPEIVSVVATSANNLQITYTTTGSCNNVTVARSSDGGATWFFGSSQGCTGVYNLFVPSTSLTYYLKVGVGGDASYCESDIYVYNTSSTTTTTTEALDCMVVQFHNPTDDNHQIFWTACDGTDLGATVLPGATLTYCIAAGTFYGDPEIVVTEIGDC